MFSMPGIVRRARCTGPEPAVHPPFRRQRHNDPMPLRLRPLLTLLLPALALAATPLPAAASGRHDHDQARAAVKAGDILPLPQVLDRVARTHPGQVLEVELEREDGRWIYELRVLQPTGALLKLDVDARTGDVLKAKEARR